MTTQDLALASPILLPAFAALLVILVDLLPGGKDSDGSFFLAVLGALVSLAYTGFYLAGGRSGPAFSNSLNMDEMALTITFVIHFSALLSILLSRYYLGGGDAVRSDLPREVLLPKEVADREVLAEVLGGEAGRRVAVLVPVRGEKRRLLELAEVNARQVLEDRVTALAYAADRAEDALFSLQSELDSLPPFQREYVEQLLKEPTLVGSGCNQQESDRRSEALTNILSQLADKVMPSDPVLTK